MTKTITVADIFCGMGGLSYGFTKAGFHIVEAHDNSNYAIDTYNLNHDNPCGVISDIGDSNFKLLTDPDIIVGGCPCQDFSLSGKKIGLKGDNGRLLLNFMSIVKKYQPKIFLIENVPNIINFPDAISAISDIENYRINYYVLNSANYMVPQNRKRIIFLGFRSDIKFNGINRLINKKININPITVRQHLGEKCLIENYYVEPFFRGNKAVWSVDEVSPTIRAVCDRPSPLPNIRSLNIREKLMIQSFPDKWIFPDDDSLNKRKKVRCIGNSVPPNLSFHIANCLTNITSTW